jgi:hypothetical protein
VQNLKSSPSGALNENVRKSCGFLAVPPGGPQRKLEKSNGFPAGPWLSVWLSLANKIELEGLAWLGDKGYMLAAECEEATQQMDEAMRPSRTHYSIWPRCIPIVSEWASSEPDSHETLAEAKWKPKLLVKAHELNCRETKPPFPEGPEGPSSLEWTLRAWRDLARTKAPSGLQGCPQPGVRSLGHFKQTEVDCGPTPG